MTSLRDHPLKIFYSPADDPLNNFYIPALSASVRYDRSAGFFSSSALAVAAAGVARLIQNGGHMRLLVGADLSEQDVEAIQQGHDLKERITQRMLERFPDPQDALMKERLEILAWMIAEGTLEIKVVLPRDEHGRPLPASVTQDYYHAKMGVFTDAEGNQVGFSGSVNESETAWKKNYEQLTVFFSWDTTASYLEQHKINFERLWNGTEKDWLALDIPNAVHNQLLKYRPARPPKFDPLERKKEEQPSQIADQLPSLRAPSLQERILFQFLRDAPYLPNAVELGARTSAIQPWPHQLQVARTIVERFPDRAMLCDEVGLGKTIEAGLAIRQLLLSGRVKRCLILAPKSVLKQWQEELYEKFALEIPRYDSNAFWNINNQRLDVNEANPWNAFDVMLAGSQLAKRADRRDEILSAAPWDLLVVDEAHHARRKDFLQRNYYRPNNLLSLLNDCKTSEKYASLLLLTATPMQVHPLEVWDLLSTLGLGGRWGANEDDFLEYFTQLRLPFEQIEWEFVFDMLRDHLESGGKIEDSFIKEAKEKLGNVKWEMLAELPVRAGQREGVINSLGQTAQSFIVEMARQHTPMNRYMFRNTRTLLREYERKGLLNANVPTRKPEVKRVPMRSEEQTLYDRIDEYITQFYHKYENERRGLGFVMTVYRRRLTSSFYAVRCSLDRRLRFLQGQIGEQDIYTDDDTEQDELDFDVETKSGQDKDYFKAELDYVRDFIQELRLLSITDSKLEVLKGQLIEIFHKRSTVIIFTQYADTMDYLREQLKDVYGNEIACYSGRGGEVWNGIAWVETTKESVKEDFKKGTVRILLCTDSASEGLNLQTCGVLINYDMPWNPMRVEQRIGRIDRINQEFPDVWISNYFYKDTIEDQIHTRLQDRIKWFEVVVGELQPILAEVGEVTRRLAMLSPTEREIELENEIRKLKNRLQQRSFASLDLDLISQVDIFSDPSLTAPVTLEQLEYILTTSPTTTSLFTHHPEIDGAYLLHWRGSEYPVTFLGKVFDEYPVTVRLLTLGSPFLNEIFNEIPVLNDDTISPFLRFYQDGEIKISQWYIVNENSIMEIATVRALQENLAKLNPSQIIDSISASKKFEEVSTQITSRYNTIIQYRRTAEYLSNKKRAQMILVKAALIEIALGRQADMFETESYPIAFNEQAIMGLQRHRFPWSALLQLVFEPGITLKEEDTYFKKIGTENRRSLKSRFAELTKEAREIIPLMQLKNL